MPKAKISNNMTAFGHPFLLSPLILRNCDNSQIYLMQVRCSWNYVLQITRGVTRSRATRSREIKLDDITRRVKNRSRKICDLSKLLFVACGGSNAPMLHLGCQNLKKEKEKKRRRKRESTGSIESSLKLCSKLFPITDIVYYLGCSPFCSGVRILSG